MLAKESVLIGQSRAAEYKWFVYGLRDGQKSRTLKNPIHLNWSKEGHSNKDYEKGYWEGYR